MQRLFTLIILTCLSSAFFAQNVQDVLRLIATNNLQLQALQQSQEASLLDLKAENTLGETSVEYSPFFRGGIAVSELIVTQEVDFPTRYAARRHVAARRHDAQQMEYERLRRDILLAAKETCIDLLAAQQQEALLRRRLAIADSLTLLIEHRQQQGDATRLDINRIRLDRMEVLASLTDCKALQESCRSALQAAGCPAFEQLEDDGSLDTLTALPQSETSIEVRTATAQQQAEAQEVRAGRQGWLPRLSVGYRRNTEMGESFHGLLVGGSMPLFSQGKRAKAADRRLSAATLQTQEARRQTEARILSQTQEVEHYAAALRGYDLALMQETLHLLLRSLQLGELSLTNYLTETDIIYRKSQERIDLQSRYRKALARLQQDSIL